MHSWWHTLIALFISFGIVFSSLPLTHIHDHVELICTDHTESADACHMQIYHGYNFAEFNCNHNTHIHAEIKKCEWCKFVKPIRDNFANLNYTELIQFNILTKFNSEYVLKNSLQIVFNHQGRAPPVS